MLIENPKEELFLDVCQLKLQLPQMLHNLPQVSKVS